MNAEADKQIPKEDQGKSSSPAPSSQAGSGAGGRSGIGKLISRIASAIGFGRRKTDDSGGGTTDVGTQLAHERTDLAVDRSYLAIERTLMAWIRTSLSMISFGFTIGKLGQVLKELEVKGPRGQVHTLSAEQLAHFLVILGTVALIGASLQHWIRMRKLYAMGLRRQLSITLIVALVLSVLGGFALAALVLAL